MSVLMSSVWNAGLLTVFVLQNRAVTAQQWNGNNWQNLAVSVGGKSIIAEDLAAVSWVSGSPSVTYIRLYTCRDSKVFEYEWDSSSQTWSSGSLTTASVNNKNDIIGVSAAISSSSQSIRANALREQGGIVEYCTDDSGSSWYVGQYQGEASGNLTPGSSGLTIDGNSVTLGVSYDSGTEAFTWYQSNGDAITSDSIVNELASGNTSSLTVQNRSSDTTLTLLINGVEATLAAGATSSAFSLSGPRGNSRVYRGYVLSATDPVTGNGDDPVYFVKRASSGGGDVERRP